MKNDQGEVYHPVFWFQILHLFQYTPMLGFKGEVAITKSRPVLTRKLKTIFTEALSIITALQEEKQNNENAL